MRVSVLHSEKLQALLLALRGFDRELQGQIRRATKAIGQPQWQSAVRAQATTELETRVLANTARMSVSNQNVTLAAGGVGRALSGGAKPSAIARAVEHGAHTKETIVHARSRKGKPYQYRRVQNRGFRPSLRSGYVFYPAAVRMIPRFLALWAQTSVRTAHETFEKGT